MNENKLNEIEKQLLELYVEIQNNKNATDDDLEETYFKMIKTMFELSANCINFLDLNAKITI